MQQQAAYPSNTEKCQFNNDIFQQIVKNTHSRMDADVQYSAVNR